MIRDRIIFVDVDDVCAQLLHGWIGRYNRDWNDSLTTADFKAWDMTLHVKAECGRKIYDYLHDKTLYDEIVPVAGALEGVQTLRDLGFRVVFATATNVQMAGRKHIWLNDHGFLEKGLLHGTTTKEVAELQDKSLLLGWGLIDDGMHNVSVFQGNRILLSRPHNESISADELRGLGIHRVRDWGQATGKVALLLAKELSESER